MKERNPINSGTIVLVMTSYFVLAFYVYGATIMEVFVYYPTWKYIHTDWVAWKSLVDARIIPRYVIPSLLVYVPLIMMFWYRPGSIPRWAVWGSLISYLVPTLSTLLVQLPIQLKLEEGFDVALYEQLVNTDLYYRQVALFFYFTLTIYLLCRLIRDAAFHSAHPA